MLTVLLGSRDGGGEVGGCSDSTFCTVCGRGAAEVVKPDQSAASVTFRLPSEIESHTGGGGEHVVRTVT